MKAELEYKGYVGSAEVDLEGQMVAGRLLFIADTITYSSATVAGIEQAFREAVDEYLATCQQCGDAPDTPCKGSFNVRVDPALHREAALRARRDRTSLNRVVEQALQAHLQPRVLDTVVELQAARMVRASVASEQPKWETVGVHGTVQ